MKKVFSRPFTAAESEESSTFKELTAVKETWTRIDVLEEFRGKTVGHFTDNKAVVYIMVVLETPDYSSFLWIFS